MHGSSNPIALVSDDDIAGLLAATPGAVVVKATMDPCRPCELMAEHKRSYAPFADKIAAHSQAQAAGTARYGEIMQAAVEAFLTNSKR